jgi:peroxiredoxin family protein
MPPERRPLSLIVESGGFRRVHYALAIAAAAAAVGRPATLFFTMDALRALEAEEGWRALPGAEADARLAAAGCVDFETLVASCAELGVTFMVCEMGLKAIGLARGRLRDDVPIADGGLATLLMQDGELVVI